MPSRFRQLREQGKRAADRNGYTSAEVEELTQDELATDLRMSATDPVWAKGNVGLFTALRSHIAVYRRRQEDEAMASAIEGNLTIEQRMWFRANAEQYEGHLDNMAKRKMIKMFLEHLFRVWREALNLPATKPYVLEHGGHHHYYSPWDFGDK